MRPNSRWQCSIHNATLEIFVLFLTIQRFQGKIVIETILRTDEGQPDRNIFSINVELTSTFLLYRGLVHHHHRILNLEDIVVFIEFKVFNLKTPICFPAVEMRNSKVIIF